MHEIKLMAFVFLLWYDEIVNVDCIESEEHELLYAVQMSGFLCVET